MMTVRVVLLHTRCFMPKHNFTTHVHFHKVGLHIPLQALTSLHCLCQTTPTGGPEHGYTFALHHDKACGLLELATNSAECRDASIVRLL
jgi:hypothetical protein